MALSTTTTNNIDDEWSNFITNNYDDSSSTDEENNLHDEFNEKNIELNSTEIFQGIAPEPTPIYISTKSKIAYLEQPVDLRIFWQIPVISYATPENGVIKKQIKINSKSPEELLEIQSRLTKELYFEEHIMSHIDNPNGRIKFKDIRKITIGISKKDIMSYRSKKKQAFYNCFVMIIRIKIAQSFREFHIKVFNTGKLEIPGVQSEEMFETVLKAIYDPCSYPGIQCKFYYNNDIGIQTGKQISSENKIKYQNITEVSFMIFRTGSVLIVGMCDENILQEIYGFLKVLLKEEFNYICQKLITADNYVKDKKKKIRKKIINIVNEIENESVVIIPSITEEIIVVAKKPRVKKVKNI